MRGVRGVCTRDVQGVCRVCNNLGHFVWNPTMSSERALALLLAQKMKGKNARNSHVGIVIRCFLDELSGWQGLGLGGPW